MNHTSNLYSQNLTMEQKAVYNQRAKGGPVFNEQKMDTRGVPLAWKEKEEQKKIIEKIQVFQKIEDLVSYFHTQGSRSFTGMCSSCLVMFCSH